MAVLAITVAVFGIGITYLIPEAAHQTFLYIWGIFWGVGIYQIIWRD